MERQLLSPHYRQRLGRYYVLPNPPLSRSSPENGTPSRRIRGQILSRGNKTLRKPKICVLDTEVWVEFRPPPAILKVGIIN
ncbi:hypothetical protein OAF37_03125 [Rubripirellula sp.]|nr:hypothetical protein [Rubripirellula sp.]MDB4645029.1 hypothetical protein [Rubripirellula sp.]